MAKTDNLQDFLTDVANSIRTKKGTTQPINAQNFSTEILNISTGGGNTLKKLLDATHSAKSLFEGYAGTSVNGLIAYEDTGKVYDITNMFRNCNELTTIPLINTALVKNMALTFYGCSKLSTIPQLDVRSVYSMSNTFLSCSSLKSILMTGMKVSFDISASTKFERADLVTILNNLATVTSTQTLTMGATNLAKLTDEDKAIATNKGWTLA